MAWSPLQRRHLGGLDVEANRLEVAADGLFHRRDRWRDMRVVQRLGTFLSEVGLYLLGGRPLAIEDDGDDGLHDWDLRQCGASALC
jgi:hypothetical protein